MLIWDAHAVGVRRRAMCRARTETRRDRDEIETREPALTHATDTSVRVEIGLARSALPPLQTPTLLWVLLVVSQGLQLLGAAAGRGRSARGERDRGVIAFYPTSNYAIAG